MFHDIPVEIQERMYQLEQIDAIDRSDGTARSLRLRQVPTETGKFLALMTAAAPAGSILEIGTSAGYSTMWLALACRLLQRSLTTFEISPGKTRQARETFALTGLSDVVELVARDALEVLPRYKRIAFCFLDAEKEIYGACYEAVIPNLVAGGMLLADNVISHSADLGSLVGRAESDRRVDSVTVPIGKGILLCRKV
jgi:predicted O-methyltransferase YrrM